MIGRHISLMLLIALLVSGMGRGGWSTPVPGLAQDTGDAVDVADDNRDVADASVFYAPLAPYGMWTALPEYGQVWIPRGVHAGWRPYTDGRWVYTDQGWTWVSDWEWGWAPFHYGRWAFVTGYGWVWVPGTVWGPAWVAWRYAPGWVGWAPLPPQVVFRPGVEITVANTAVPIAPSWFCFVEEHRILAPHVVTYIAPPVRNVALIQITQNVTHYTVIQNRVINRGIPVERIERVIARPVPRLRIVEAHAPEAMHGARIREREREVVVFRPHVHPGARTSLPGAQTSSNPPPVQLAPGTTLPQQQDARRRLLEQQTRERAALEERQRHAPQPQSVSPEELRARHEAERRALEEKARQARQQQAIQQQAIQQQLQPRQAQERQRVFQPPPQQQPQPPAQPPLQPQQQLQQRQAQERQRVFQPPQQQPQPPAQPPLQQQLRERQRVFPPPQSQPPAQPQLQQQLQQQQRTMLQPHHQQPSPPQGVPPAVSQQQRAADAKEQRKQHQQPPPQQ